MGYARDVFSETTDKNGVATFDWVPDWNKHVTTFWPVAEGYTRPRADYYAAQKEKTKS